MEEKRCVVSKKEAINILNKAMDAINAMDDDALFVISIDLDREEVSGNGKYIPRKKGEELIIKSETRIFSGNRYMSQLDLYSVRQPDIFNIKPKGVIKTILLGGI